jgi:zinc finger protein
MAAPDNPSSALFTDLNADCNDDLAEIESLCLACREQGVTRLLLTKIPFFREVIVSSFQCDHCGHIDRSIQSAGRIQDRGVRCTLTVATPRDLNRQVVKSEYASFSIPELEFEQPAIRKGDITTVEGLLDAIVTGLMQLQTERRDVDPEKAMKIDEFIVKLQTLKKLDRSFVIVLDDPSGNSYVENPHAPSHDDSLAIVHYTRTHQQDIDIGCVVG